MEDKEFKLSEKRKERIFGGFYLEDDVKEFIRRDKNLLLHCMINGKIDVELYFERKDKLVGELGDKTKG